jgi:hypothetical protein
MGKWLGWNEAGCLNILNYRFKISTMVGRKNFDKSKIHEKLTQHIRDGISADDLLDKCQKKSTAYERLYINRINRIQTSVV